MRAGHHPSRHSFRTNHTGIAVSGQFADFSVLDFIFNVLLVYIRGCATDKGRASIDEFIKKHHF